LRRKVLVEITQHQTPEHKGIWNGNNCEIYIQVQRYGFDPRPGAIIAPGSLSGLERWHMATNPTSPWCSWTLCEKLADRVTDRIDKKINGLLTSHYRRTNRIRPVPERKE